jgi:hypothetical protein
MKQNITSDIPGIAAIKQEMGVSQNIWHTIKRHFLIHMFRGVFFETNSNVLVVAFRTLGDALKTQTSKYICAIHLFTEGPISNL